VRSDKLLEHLRSASDPVEALHLTTHGVHERPPDESRIMVGPIDGKPEAGVEFVTLENVGSLTRPKLKFAFFNCCELGFQASPTQLTGSYHGGFAAGLVKERITSEVICHRWSVTAKWALEFAREFYRSRPRTVHARAAALARARWKIKEMMRQAKVQNSMWMAPIHIWAYPVD
jgi:CHAT domain-containing protein